MLYSPVNEATFFIIWCHGNGDDIGNMGMRLAALSQGLQAHFLIFEYPSYGLYAGVMKLNENTINNHAERAFLFARDTLQWPTDRILVYGHSLGTGPACHLASTKPI
ncbi:unnamed protein product, partial [Rotaria sp. Silwood1]